VLSKKNEQQRTVGERKEKNGVVLRLICVKKKEKKRGEMTIFSLLMI